MPNCAPAGDCLCWIGYALLAASTGGPFWSYAYLGVPAAFILAWQLRRKASGTGDLALYDHAVWLLRTGGSLSLLYLLGLAALLSLFYAIGNDDAAMASLNGLEQAMTTETLSAQERIARLLQLGWMQLLLGGGLLWWFLLAWPLKRLLHGMLALRRALAPQALPRSCRLAAAAAALFLQTFLLFLFL